MPNEELVHEITEAVNSSSSAIDKMKGMVSFIVAIFLIGGTFAVNQYQVSELKSKVAVLEGDSKSVLILQTDMKYLVDGFKELKESNAKTSQMLVDYFRDNSNGNNRSVPSNRQSQ